MIVVILEGRRVNGRDTRELLVMLFLKLSANYTDTEFVKVRQTIHLRVLI